MTWTFLSTPSARRATRDDFEKNFGEMLFLSTPSARRATYFRWRHLYRIHDFYPRPPRGGRHAAGATAASAADISIHALREEGDLLQMVFVHLNIQFLSTPSARRATKRRRMERTAQRYFYPRPPRGGRPKTISILHGRTIFLSTPSARRATAWAVCILPLWAYFYPRPPRGGRRPHSGKPSIGPAISIHALREEGDLKSGLL